MAEPDKIRLESLKETLKQTQRYMILGIGSAVILLSVIIQSPDLAESGTKVVKLPFIGEVDRMMAGFVLIIAGFAFGAVAVSGVNRITHISREIEDETLVKAALTFPSILTIRNAVLRVTSSLLPPLLLLVGYLVEHFRSETPFSINAVIGLLIIASPYLTLALLLGQPLSERCIKARTATLEYRAKR